MSSLCSHSHFAPNIPEVAKFIYNVYMYEHRYASPPKTVINTLYLSPTFLLSRVGKVPYSWDLKQMYKIEKNRGQSLNRSIL